MKLKFISLIALFASMQAAAVTVDTVAVATTHLDSPMNVIVYTPDKATRGEKCPTVYLLNGYSGDYTSWSRDVPRLRDFSDDYGMIFVCTDGRNSWYWDSPIDPSRQVESAIVKDVVPFVDSHYPTIADARHRAVTGMSMGGHGAIWLAARHPDVWGSAGSMSGGVDIRPFPDNWEMAQRLGSYADNKEVWDSHTVTEMVPVIKESGINLLFDCGVDDFFAEVNRELHRKLLEAKVPHDYTERPGAHTWDYWRNATPYHLAFFHEVFRK